MLGGHPRYTLQLVDGCPVRIASAKAKSVNGIKRSKINVVGGIEGSAIGDSSLGLPQVDEILGAGIYYDTPSQQMPLRVAQGRTTQSHASGT